jgi:hypothetical protein
VCGYGYGGSDIKNHNALIAEYDRLKATGRYENSLVGTLYMLHLACGNTHACGAGWADDIHVNYIYLSDAEKPDAWWETLGESFLMAFMIWAPGAIARFRGMRTSPCACPTGNALRPVGQVLESIDDIMANPQLLKGMSPAQVEAIIGRTPGWQVERLEREAMPVRAGCSVSTMNVACPLAHRFGGTRVAGITVRILTGG